MAIIEPFIVEFGYFGHVRYFEVKVEFVVGHKEGSSLKINWMIFD